MILITGKNLKSQAALEFLTTYGWALIIILIAIGAISYFGILNPSAVLPERCTFGPELQCVDHSVFNNGLMLRMKNNAGDTIKVNSVGVSYEGSDLDCGSLIIGEMWNMGRSKDVLIACDFSDTEIIGSSKKKLNVKLSFYSTTSSSTFSKEVLGEVYSSANDIPIRFGFVAMFPTIAKYATAMDNTKIFQNGVEIYDVATPSAGTFLVNEGDIITSNKPIGLFNNIYGMPFPNLNGIGTRHAFYSSRYQPHTVLIYAASRDTTVNYYHNKDDSGGVPDQTINVPAGQVGILILALEGDHRFYSTSPVIMIKKGTPGDDIFIPPASNEVLHSFSENRLTMDVGATINNANNVLYTSPSPLSSTQIADGAGGDADMGMPSRLLGNSYVLTHPIGDFAIVSYQSNIVEVYEYSGGSFVLWNTYDHSAASASNPLETEVGDQSGAGADLGLSIPILIKGTSAFYLRTNDENDNEYPAIGWVE